MELRQSCLLDSVVPSGRMVPEPKEPYTHGSSPAADAGKLVSRLFDLPWRLR